MPNLFDSCLPMTRHRSICALTALGAVLGALALSGCASEEAASRFLVEPDRYVLYSCLEIATASQSNMNRQRELEALMTKAGTDTGGQIASSMAYRPECSNGLSPGIQPVARGDGPASQGRSRQELQKRPRCSRSRCGCARCSARSGPHGPERSDRPLKRGTFFRHGTCRRGTRHDRGPNWGRAWAF